MTKAAVQEFLRKDGPKLQEMLKEYAQDKQRCGPNLLPLYLQSFKHRNFKAILRSFGMSRTFRTATPSYLL